jgi:hypothetical protein
VSKQQWFITERHPRTKEEQMRYTETQNPRNKVGRNSGAGPAGISEIVPTPQEAARGLEPMSVGGRRWSRPLGMGLGALALAGAGVAGYLGWQRTRKPTLRSRLERMVPWS